MAAAGLGVMLCDREGPVEKVCLLKLGIANRDGDRGRAPASCARCRVGADGPAGRVRYKCAGVCSAGGHNCGQQQCRTIQKIGAPGSKIHNRDCGRPSICLAAPRRR